MFITRSTFAAVALSLGTSGAMAAGPIETLYDGTGKPASQGWSVVGEGHQIQHDGTMEFLTANASSSRTSPFFYFRYDTGATDYIASIRLQVVSANYNYLDAGLTFNMFGDNPITGPGRTNTLMIGNDIVVWGDLVGGSVALDTNVFHDYAFRYNDGELDLYIDASFEDIAAGTATALLSRTITTLPAGTTSVGHLMFGDATNDPGYNSTYIVDSVRFQNLAISAVPEPSTVAMMGLGLAVVAMGARRRKRTAAYS